MSKVLNFLTPDYNYYPPSNKRLFPVICQVGVGGTGSAVAQQLSQMLMMFGKKSYYCLADPDTIENKNINNQLFVESNIGKKKAEILAGRYSQAYGIPVHSFTESYIEDVNALRRLFNIDYHSYSGSTDVVLPILIGCVDNNYTRRIFHELFETVPTLLYLDSGNESAAVPNDYPVRPKSQWTEDELKDYNFSGWTGQVCAGLKWHGQTILKPVASRFPEIMVDDDEIKPSQLSCEELSASDPQRLQTNRMAALALCSYLSELFECGTISKSLTVFHAQKGYMKSELINENTPSI
ncbi:ThiF family adenylyltransferase [Bacillus sp. RO1]|uniref:ThiF family adenylyltransferase n=1 Tax=Bacillus sp. RO1 TaxID=2722703 RepID=UPI0014567AB5|nr:ThiF family adenylyltransferase [Bacillus sp. RO1]NLP52183.1 thiamine biosynthesis protein ThiF [Bacillus sp. RO1]